MKKLSILILAVLSLFAVSVMAHEKVVVIPLTGKTTVNVANFTGTWTPSTTYQAGQTMQIDGSTYVALTTHTSDPTTPDMGNWSLMAAKGDKGDIGLKGDKGDQGIQGEQGIQGVPGVGDSWIRVYDNNNVFIGYKTDLSLSEPVLSGNNYATILEPDLARYSTLDSFYYLTSDCTGQKYYRIIPVSTTTIKTYYGTGYLYLNIFDNNTYYVTYSSTPVVVTAGNTYYTQGIPTAGVCTGYSSAGDYYFAELTTNNPSTTGFPNSSTLVGPIHYGYTLPSAP